MRKIEAVDFFYLSMPEVTTEGDGSQDALLVRVTAGALKKQVGALAEQPGKTSRLDQNPDKLFHVRRIEYLISCSCTYDDGWRKASVCLSILSAVGEIAAGQIEDDLHAAIGQNAFAAVGKRGCPAVPQGSNPWTKRGIWRCFQKDYRFVGCEGRQNLVPQSSYHSCHSEKLESRIECRSLSQTPCAKLPTHITRRRRGGSDRFRSSCRLTGNYARLLAKNRDRFIDRIVCALTWLCPTFLALSG